jgi:hypothetical protein
MSKRRAKPSKPLADEALRGYYREKADQCQRRADATADAASRDLWLRLARQWTWLAQQTRSGRTLSSGRVSR